MSLPHNTTPTEDDPHPLFSLEQVLQEYGWSFDREGDVIHTGSGEAKKAYFPITFSWERELSLVHMVCAIVISIPEQARHEVNLLIAEINQKLYVGHLEHRLEAECVVYRYGLYVNEGENWSTNLLVVLHTAIETCGAYVKLLQQVASGMSAQDALASFTEENVEQPPWANAISTPLQ